MRIALLVTSFPTVSETFIMHQITGLLDRGHDVDIYAFRPPRRPAVHEALERYRLLERTVYWGFEAGTPRWSKLTRMVSSGPAVLREVSRVPGGVRGALRLMAVRRAVSPILLYGVQVFQRNGRSRYDIIHGHYGRNGTTGVLLREMGVLSGRVVTSFHGNDMSGFVQSRGRAVYEDLFRLGDLFLPVSERWRRRLIELGCDPDRIVVHRLGIDTTRFRHLPRVPAAAGEVRVITVARLVEKKGIADALNVFARVAPAWPGLRYTVVGDGPLAGPLRRLAADLGIAGRVRFLGPKSQEEVIALLGEADLFLLPSATAREGDQEGIPVALMEAMAAGLPVLSTLHSAIPELVQDGVSGYLVGEHDVERLSARLSTLLAQPERRAAMGQAGRDIVLRDYDLSASTERLVGLYEKLLLGAPVAS